MKETFMFCPEVLEDAMRQNLQNALRELADAIESGKMEARLLSCESHGFGPAWDPREHVLIKLDVSSLAVTRASTPEPKQLKP